MNKISNSFFFDSSKVRYAPSRSTRRPIWVAGCAIAVGVCLSLSSQARGSELHAEAAAPSGCNPVFAAAIEYDKGVQTSVAAHPSGLFIEFHQTELPGDETIYYRFGRSDGTRVVWGTSQKSGLYGYWPSVAVNKEGCLLVVVSDSKYKNGSRLDYRVGKIQPYGGNDQSLTWLTEKTFWDNGFHASVAINDEGVIAGVHETGHASTGLYYRVGHFIDPAAGNFAIYFDSGPWGRWYDDGINPHIALNNLNQIVEVHQVRNENLLHYWRGTVENGQIQLNGSRRYHNDARQPAVALLDSGIVLEAHVDADKSAVIVTSGTLNADDPAQIDWAASTGLGGVGSFNTTCYPALAADGMEVVATFSGWDWNLGSLAHAVGKICP